MPIGPSSLSNTDQGHEGTNPPTPKSQNKVGVGVKLHRTIWRYDQPCPSASLLSHTDPSHEGSNAKWGWGKLTPPPLTLPQRCHLRTPAGDALCGANRRNKVGPVSRGAIASSWPRATSVNTHSAHAACPPLHYPYHCSHTLLHGDGCTVLTVVHTQAFTDRY